MPKFSVSQFSTLNLSFDEDVEAYVAGGAEGIGIAEFKLPEGRDEESAATLRAAGLPVTICIPTEISILPLPDFPGPDDPAERIESLCASMRRLAAFDPVTVLALTGPSGDRDPDEARSIAVDGLRTVAREAASVGVRLSLEPVHRSAAAGFTWINTIPDAVELIEEVGEPMGILFDTWHLWDTPDLLDHVRAQAHRFPAVHVNDWRAETRGWDDRALPGEGVIDLPAILGALEAGGFDGFYDFELFSSEHYPDSYLKLPAPELIRRAKAGFLAAWEARR